MAFMWSWNEFMGPLVYLRDQSKFPLSLGLFNLRVENLRRLDSHHGRQRADDSPRHLIFFFCQRYFIQGMTMSGMKA